MPADACALPGGLMCVAQQTEGCRLPIISCETGELVRHLLPPDRPINDLGGPRAVVFGGDAIFAIGCNCIRKFSYPAGEEILVHRLEGKPDRLYNAADLIGGVLYVVDFRNACVLPFDPRTLKPSGSPIGRLVPGGDRDKAQGPLVDDDFREAVALPADGFRQPMTVRAHPEGLMVTDCETGRIVVLSTDGQVVRTLTGFERCFDAVCLDGKIVAADASDLVVLEPSSGEVVCRKRMCAPEKHCYLTALCAVDGHLYAFEALPRSCIHVLSLTPADASPERMPVLPIKPPVAPKYDLCVVGGGVVGCSIARDIASCGYKVLLVEKGDAIGGVWHRNRYPGLRLHAPGHSYRALSKAPEWQKAAERIGSIDRIAYRPTQSEILAYVQSLPEHPNITVALSTTFCYSEEVKARGSTRHTVICDGLRADVEAVVYATGSYETTAGKKFVPFDADAVTNGARIVHSSEMSANKEFVDGARHRYLIGASKAAIDVLQSMDPNDENITWAHRGHIIFFSRDVQNKGITDSMEWLSHYGSLSDAEQAAHREAFANGRTGKIRGSMTANKLLKQQLFGAYDSMIQTAGLGTAVGQPLSRSGIATRGGVESEVGMGHCRKFSKQQKLFKKMEVRGGALTLSCEDGSVLAPGEGDVVILCTGQRAEGFGPGYHRACATKNRGGIFMPYAFSGTATGVAMYWTHMVVSYLDKKPTSYSRGTFFDQALKVACSREGWGWAEGQGSGVAAYTTWRVRVRTASAACTDRPHARSGRMHAQVRLRRWKPCATQAHDMMRMLVMHLPCAWACARCACCACCIWRPS